MKTIIVTNIKHFNNIHVSQSVSEIYDLLISKGSFMLLDRGEKGEIVLSKSSVKLIKERNV